MLLKHQTTHYVCWNLSNVNLIWNISSQLQVSSVYLYSPPECRGVREAVVPVRGVGVVLVLAQPVDVHPREGEGLSVQQQTGSRPDHKPELTVTQRLHTLTNYTILAQREIANKESLLIVNRIFSGSGMFVNKMFRFWLSSILLQNKHPLFCRLCIKILKSLRKWPVSGFIQRKPKLCQTWWQRRTWRRWRR